MRDIPFFTTELGVASLTLAQIPYTKQAYIRIQDSASPDAFLLECIGFCKAAGAEKIFATGHKVCEKYPEHTKLFTMLSDKQSIGETDAALFPVTEVTLSKWVDIYNRKIVNIPNGAWMTASMANQMLQSGDGYFVHRGTELLGIGKASGSEISWVASVSPGAGADVVRALCHALTEDTVSLTVASTNTKAVTLYKELGFIPTGIVSVWYAV